VIAAAELSTAAEFRCHASGEAAGGRFVGGTEVPLKRNIYTAGCQTQNCTEKGGVGKC